jgi:hypothetical protein
MSSSAPLPRVVAALHLLPSAESCQPSAQPLNKIIDHALVHTQIAWDSGIRAMYYQDVHDVPVSRTVSPEKLAQMTQIGQEIKKAFPELRLGVCFMQNGAREPLQVACDIGAEFVRIKVYIGVMIKAEGMVQGCCYDAIQYRERVCGGGIKIIADVYDRVGMPLAPMPWPEACRHAVQFGRADGLVLTGHTVEDSIRIFDQMTDKNLSVPLFLGGGATPQTVRYFPKVNHFIVHAAFVRRGLPEQNGVPVEWDKNAIREFLNVVK